MSQPPPAISQPGPRAEAQTTRPPSQSERSQSQHQQSDSLPTSSAPAPRLLDDPEIKLQFGQARSRRTRRSLVVNVIALERVASSTFTIMEYSLKGISPITRPNFIRVVKTLILKRLQDLVEAYTCIRPTGAIQIGRSVEVPQPISELLYALGNYYCPQNGIQYTLDPPTPPTVDPPSFFQVDPNVLSTYITFMKMTTSYKKVPFPKMSESEGLPLMLLTKEEYEGQCQIRGVFTMPTPSDAYLRFVHEELFVEPPFMYEDCQFVMSEQMYYAEIITQYTLSYMEGE